MTATEELRRLLDVRGVEWWSMHDAETGYRADQDTEFAAHGCKHVAHEWGNRLQVDMLTPEQAIAATLGAGECTLESAHGYCDPYVRTAYVVELSCHTLDAWDDPVPPSYCPYCGKRVVKEDA
jgi:hypothetical protein